MQGILKGPRLHMSYNTIPVLASAPSFTSHENPWQSPVFFRECFRVITRVWGAVMPPSAQSIVWMILDRTAGWGKESERIPLSHFTDGVYLRNKEAAVHPGTGLDRGTVTTWLSALIAAGAVRDHGNGYLSLNMQWEPRPIGKQKRFLKRERTITVLATPGQNTAPAPSFMPLAISKKQSAAPALPSVIRQSKKAAPPPEDGGKFPPTCRKFPPECGKFPHIKEGKGKGEKIRDSGRGPEQPPGTGELSGKLASIERGREARREVVQKAKALPAGEALGRWFDDLVQRHHPAAPFLATRRADAAILRRFALRFCADRKRDFPAFRDFLEWTVQNWVLISKTEMSWCKKLAEFPQVRVLVGLGDHFATAFARRSRIEAQRQMTPEDGYRDELARQGRSPEAIERAVQKRFGAAKDMAAEQEKLMQARKGLEFEKARLTARQEREAKARALQERTAAYQRAGNTLPVAFAPFREDLE